MQACFIALVLLLPSVPALAAPVILELRGTVTEHLGFPYDPDNTAVFEPTAPPIGDRITFTLQADPDDFVPADSGVQALVWTDVSNTSIAAALVSGVEAAFWNFGYLSLNLIDGVVDRLTITVPYPAFDGDDAADCGDGDGCLFLDFQDPTGAAITAAHLVDPAAYLDVFDPAAFSQRRFEAYDDAGRGAAGVLIPEPSTLLLLGLGLLGLARVRPGSATRSGQR